MATAHKRVVEVPQRPIYEDRIVLELTTEEAKTLLYVTQSVGGKPTGPRGDIDNIRRTLVSCGVRQPEGYPNGSVYLPDSL